MPSCYQCGKEVKVADRVGRSETCLSCGADLHCCRNCEFYDPLSYNECREPVAERVVDKERANFCDMFQMAAERLKEKDRTTDAKKKLEELFKKKG